MPDRMTDERIVEHRHVWDDEPLEQATFTPPASYDVPWLIHACVEGACNALKIQRLVPVNAPQSQFQWLTNPTVYVEGKTLDTLYGAAQAEFCGRLKAEAQVETLRETLERISLLDGANAPAGVPTDEFLRSIARAALEGAGDA